MSVVLQWRRCPELALVQHRERRIENGSILKEASESEVWGGIGYTVSGTVHDITHLTLTQHTDMQNHRFLEEPQVPRTLPSSLSPTFWKNHHNLQYVEDGVKYLLY